MKKKINSKHIFDNLSDALKFVNYIESAGFKRDEYTDDGGLVFVNADGYTLYVAVQQKIRINYHTITLDDLSIIQDACFMFRKAIQKGEWADPKHLRENKLTQYIHAIGYIKEGSLIRIDND